MITEQITPGIEENYVSFDLPASRDWETLRKHPEAVRALARAAHFETLEVLISYHDKARRYTISRVDRNELCRILQDKSVSHITENHVESPF